MAKKNWKLWGLFWHFLRTHRKDYKYFKETNDIDFIYNAADEFVVSLLKEYNINVHVTYDDESIKDKQVLFVSNHQSMFDPLFLFQYLNHPCGFFIAGSFERLLKIKPIKTIIGASQSVYIYRGDIRKTALQIKKASDVVKNSNYSYMVFPEGRIKIESVDDQEHFNGKTNEFMAGAFKIAKNNNLLIVPITIKDSEKIHHTTNYFDMLEAGDVHIRFHKPITPEEYQDLNTQQIANLARSVIESDL